MRYVVLADLEPVTAKAKGDGGQLVDAPFGPADLVRWLLDSDKRFVSDAPGIRAAVRIETQLAKADRFLALEDGDWVKLKEAAESPSVGYPLSPARRLAPFLDAISNAGERQPKPAKEAK